MAGRAGLPKGGPRRAGSPHHGDTAADVGVDALGPRRRRQHRLAAQHRAVWAVTTVVTAVINRKDVPVLVLTMAGLTVLSCIAVITFSFALYYARKDMEDGGLEFSGPAQWVFSDYVYPRRRLLRTYSDTAQKGRLWLRAQRRH